LVLPIKGLLSFELQEINNNEKNNIKRYFIIFR
jgi:hypothetical protein